MNPTESGFIPAPFADPSRRLQFAVIRGLHEGPFLARYLAGIRSMGMELGVDFVVYDADDRGRMAANIETATLQGVDAIVISSGDFDALEPPLKAALDRNIKVLGFDMTGEHPLRIPTIEQDDLLIGFLLGKKIAGDYGGIANVIYINPGVFAPAIKRDRLWQDFKWRYPGLKEIARMGAVTARTAADTEAELTGLLQRHPETTAVVAIWDEFARGAVRAITRSGLAGRVNVYSVDITDEDIRMMIEPDSPWVATVATDAFTIGRLAVRAAAALVAGERVDTYLSVEPHLITREFLIANSIGDIDELVKMLPTLGESRLVWFDWMERVMAGKGYQKSIATLPPGRIINELQRRNIQLQEAVTAAEKANRAKSVFLANMSHELRTPLNAVLGFARLMNNAPNMTQIQRENIGVITRSGEHLLNLINNVLDISKIEAGRVELEEEVLDLRQVLLELSSIMYARAGENGVEFTIEQSSDVPRSILADGGKLRQVLINLLGNAIKYSPNGRVVLRVGTKKTAAGRAVIRFEVEDTGPGIGKEDYERIFLPFEQLGTQPASETGTGLGLTISKQYVELMEGTIGVESTLGKGSLFFFEIPVEVIPDTTIPDEPKPGRIVGPAEGRTRYRLLIVEDQADNRLLLRRLLEPFGFELREASNGREALEAVPQWHPDLIFMDIRLPMMDGLEATRRIKANSEGSGIKIVAVTAHALEEERREILSAGCDGFIRKPYREADICDSLTDLLGVTFRYIPRDASPEEKVCALTLGQLKTLPGELVEELRDAVELLSVERCFDVVGRIGAISPDLGDQLRRMTEELKFSELLTILDGAVAEFGK